MMKSPTFQNPRKRAIRAIERAKKVESGQSTVLEWKKSSAEFQLSSSSSPLAAPVYCLLSTVYFLPSGEQSLRLERGFRLGVTLFHRSFAAQLYATLLVDADTFHPDNIADLDDVLHGPDAEIRQFGDVN